MLSNAYFLAKIRFDTAENEPAKKFAKFANFADPNPLTLTLGEVRRLQTRARHRGERRGRPVRGQVRPREAPRAGKDGLRERLELRRPVGPRTEAGVRLRTRLNNIE